MPTRRFYKLSESKRNRIRDAAVHEFTRVPIEMVSINRIIQEAGISRGSYYTYFENKWDILLYLMEDAAETLCQAGQRCLQQVDGNYWKMLELLLEDLILMCRESDSGNFLKNMLSDSNQEKMQWEFWKRCGKEGKNPKKESLEEEIYRACAGKSIVQMEQEQFSAFLRMTLMLVGMEVRSYIDGESISTIRRRFQMQLQILKCGVSEKEITDRSREVKLTAG